MQTKLESFFEVCFSLVIGFFVTMAISPIVYPMFGHSFSTSQNVGLTLVFTVASLIRGYVVRRWMNTGLKNSAKKLASWFQSVLQYVQRKGTNGKENF